MTSDVKQIKQVFFTDNYILQKKQMDVSEVKKLEQAIEVHGYRGQRKKKHNGVVNIKPDDKELWKSLKKYNIIEKTNIDKILEDKKFEYIFDVKIVAHCPNGNRSIGFLYKNELNELFLILLGFTNYNYHYFNNLF